MKIANYNHEAHNFHLEKNETSAHSLHLKKNKILGKVKVSTENTESLTENNNPVYLTISDLAKEEYARMQKDISAPPNTPEYIKLDIPTGLSTDELLAFLRSNSDEPTFRALTPEEQDEAEYASLKAFHGVNVISIYESDPKYTIYSVLEGKVDANTAKQFVSVFHDLLDGSWLSSLPLDEKAVMREAGMKIAEEFSNQYIVDEGIKEIFSKAVATTINEYTFRESEILYGGFSVRYTDEILDAIKKPYDQALYKMIDKQVDDAKNNAENLLKGIDSLDTLSDFLSQSGYTSIAESIQKIVSLVF